MASFDHKIFEGTLVEHYQNRLGWHPDIARRAAQIATECLRLTHGGASNYIQARVLDYEAIRADYRGGRTVTDLAQRYGVCARHIRNIVS